MTMRTGLVIGVLLCASPAAAQSTYPPHCAEGEAPIYRDAFESFVCTPLLFLGSNPDLRISFGVYGDGEISVTNSGQITLRTPSAYNPDGPAWSPNLVIETGTAEAAHGGAVGMIFILPGQGFSGVPGGDVWIRGGLGHAESGSVPGRLFLGGNDTGVYVTLPTSDPMNAGQLWNDQGVVKVSAGQP